MKKQINPSAKRTLIFIIVFLIAVFTACALLTSCKVTKTSKAITSDTTHIKSNDSGKVSRNSTSNEAALEWWKETLTFPPSKDTTINNFITQPVQIIREGGKQSAKSNTQNYDSSWRNAYDSLNAKFTSLQTTKQVKFLTWWQILLLGGGAALVVSLLSHGFLNFKITKR